MGVSRLFSPTHQNVKRPPFPHYLSSSSTHVVLRTRTRQSILYSIAAKSSNMEDDRDFSWEKPAWAKNGPGLRKTGRGQEMVGGRDLAAPITLLPHLNKDGPFQKPEWTEEVEKLEKPTSDLAKPITSLPHSGNKALEFEKPEWTKKPVLHTSDKGAALKSGKEIARPIGGIKPVEEFDD